MDKIIKIPLMIIVLLCLVNSAHAQWIDRGTYSELNINIPDIKYLKISSDSSSVFIQKADTMKKISLAEGKIIEEKYLDSLASFGIVAVSYDDMYYAYPVVDEYKATVRVHGYNNDTLINQIHLHNYYGYTGLYEYSVYNIPLYFTPENNLLIGCNYELDFGWEVYETGRINYYDPVTGEETAGILSDTGITNIWPSFCNQYIASTYYYSYSKFYGGGISDHFYEKGLYLYDMTLNKNNKLSYQNENSEKDFLDINFLAFSPDSRLLSAGNEYHSIKTWSMDSKQIIDEYILDNYYIASMIYSNSDNVMVVGTQNGRVIFLDMFGHQIIDSLSFNSLYAVNTINYINDTTILVHCSDGYLRKIPIDNYINNITEINSNNTFSLFPNPANNKLTIQCPLPDAPKATLSLYNSLGRPVRNYTITNGSNTIDISSLAPGIYLVKLLVNDEVYSAKFIKAE